MICIICKENKKSFEYRETISAELAESWRLNTKEINRFNRRESMRCRNCGCSLRSRTIAEAIVKSYPKSRTKYFVDWVKWAKNQELTIAEINYCAELHKYLKTIPGTKISQYRESTLRATVANLVKGIKREDITKLSYADNSYDLVLHSEVLEHVEDTENALVECRRILKPGGKCLFTVPLILNRKTERKARTDKATGKVTFYGLPSYHGRREENDLVFWEFGGDFVKMNKLKIALARPSDSIWVLQIDKTPFL